MGHLQYRVGIFGGTFDPVHYGHLSAASGALHLAGLEQVVFIPTGRPPHKEGKPITAPEHRLAMVRLATRGNPRFSVSTVELVAPGPHYTVDTLSRIAVQHPQWGIHFICGLDSLLTMGTWRSYRQLLDRWPLLGVLRPGFDLDEWDRTRGELGLDLTARVRILKIPGISIASRELRELLATGYPATYLVPKEVEEYIRNNKLYRKDP